MLRKEYLMVHPKTKQKMYVPKRQIQYMLEQGYYHHVNKTNKAQHTDSFNWTDIIWGRKTWGNVHIKTCFIPNFVIVNKVLFALLLCLPIAYVFTWILVHGLLH